MAQEEVLKEIASIEDLLTLLPDVPGIYAQWKQIVRDHNVQGVKVYDARLAAVASVYGVANILTFNTGDFKRYGDITALHPSLFVVVSSFVPLDKQPRFTAFGVYASGSPTG